MCKAFETTDNLLSLKNLSIMSSKTGVPGPSSGYNREKDLALLASSFVVVIVVVVDKMEIIVLDSVTLKVKNNNVAKSYLGILIYVMFIFPLLSM